MQSMRRMRQIQTSSSAASPQFSQIVLAVLPHLSGATTASMLQSIHSSRLHHLPSTTAAPRSNGSDRQHSTSRRCRATCAGQDVQCGIREGSSLSGPLNSSDPVLYTHTCCPYAERSLLAILEKGVPFEIVQVDLSNKPGWYRSIHPQTLVPSLVAGGQTVVESVDICRWVQEHLPGEALKPHSSQEAAQMDRLIAGCSGFVSAGLDICGGAWALSSSHAPPARRSFLAQLAKLDVALDKSGGPYLLGSYVSTGDLIWWPFMERFLVALDQLQGYRVQEHCGRSVAGWIRAMQSRPSVQLAGPDPTALAAAFRMHRRLDWFDFQSCSVLDAHPQLRPFLV